MSFEPNLLGQKPQVASSAYVHPTAVLLGNVCIGQNVFVGPNAVLRADEPTPEGVVEPITIGPRCNVQDGVIVHALAGTAVRIGAGVSLAHGALVHGPCEIGDECFVGFNSIVYRATLGEGVVVLHGALVEGVTVPPNRLVPSLGRPQTEAEVAELEAVGPEVRAFVDGVRTMNLRFVEGYR